MRKSGKLLCKIMPNLIVGLGAAMPAFAESFPSNGYMLENKTYSDAATEENMGAYDGTVTASAEYEDILYQIGAGTYLPAGATVAEQCPEDSYCPGMTDVAYNESAAQGISSCPSGYPNSAAGASSNTQCYTACTVSMVEHASAVSGNDYYGDGTDTCYATECENRYHVYETVKLIEQTPLIDVDYTVKANDSGHISATGRTRNNDTYGLTEKGTWAAEYGDGVVYGRASCQATPHDPGFEYLEANRVMTMSPDQVRSDLTPIVGAAKANYMADVVAGMADGTISNEAFYVAADVVFGIPKDASFSTTDTGRYCYCQMTGFQSAQSGESGYDISKAVAVESAPWVPIGITVSTSDCTNYCTNYCATRMILDADFSRSFRRALFGALDFVAGATCEVNKIAAGQYLPAGTEVAAQCPANSYCPGATGVTYNASADQGISSCPSGYPNSAAGASSNTQCYTACTLNSANIEHASAVSGNDYYGDGTDTCFATACEGGYHVEGDSVGVGVIEQTPLIDVDYTVAGSGDAYISADGGNTNNANAAGLTEKNTWATLFDYGVVYGRASCQSTPHDPGLEYITENMETIMDGKMSPDQVRSELTPIVGDAKANYFADVIAGMADGTKGEEDLYKAIYVVFGISKDASFRTTDTGQYCYCQMTGFQSGSSSPVAPVSSDEGSDTSGSDTSGIVSIASAPWVHLGSPGSADGCADECAAACAAITSFDDIVRGAVFGALGAAAPITCEANEITIKWTDATEEDIAANNAGMCTYGGDIRTPLKAATKTGKTFVGWKFSK